MKSIATLFLLLVLIFPAHSQAQDCDSVRLDNDINIKKAEPCVIIAADYVLSKPLHENNERYHEYRKFILAWIDKTPDYTFSLNEKIMALCKEDENELLFGVYTTCMAKAALQSKGDFTKNAIKMLADYVKNPANKVKQTSKIKKFIEDAESGNIDKYVK